MESVELLPNTEMESDPNPSVLSMLDKSKSESLQLTNDKQNNPIMAEMQIMFSFFSLIVTTYFKINNFSVVKLILFLLLQ